MCPFERFNPSEYSEKRQEKRRPSDAEILRKAKGTEFDEKTLATEEKKFNPSSEPAPSSSQDNSTNRRLDLPPEIRQKYIRNTPTPLTPEQIQALPPDIRALYNKRMRDNK